MLSVRMLQRRIGSAIKHIGFNTAAVLVFIFLLANQASAVDAPKCGDFLAQAGQKPPGLEYLGCMATDNFGLKVLWADYRVAGSQAEEVEAYFIKDTGLGPLTFYCCGWEAKDAAYGRIAHGQKWADPDISDAYEIHMNSGETLCTQRDEWANEIEWFNVHVLLYLESP